MHASCTTSSLRSLTSLSPQLHQNINKYVSTEHKQRHDRCISPPIVIIWQINRGQIIAANSVFTNPTTFGRIWIDQICSGPYARKVTCEISLTCFVCGRIEDCELFLGAVDGCVEGGEDEEGSHKVVKRVEVINPVPVRDSFSFMSPKIGGGKELPPKRLDLRVRHQNATE